MRKLNNNSEDQVFSQLVELNILHQKVVRNAIFGNRLTSKWYNMLPTAEKHLMDKFQADWGNFNDSVLQSARKVRATLLIKKVLIC